MKDFSQSFYGDYLGINFIPSCSRYALGNLMVVENLYEIPGVSNSREDEHRSLCRSGNHRITNLVEILFSMMTSRIHVRALR